MAAVKEKEPGKTESYHIGIREADGDGRDSLKFVGDYGKLNEMTGNLLEETDQPVYDQELENGDLRVITSGKSATVDFVPDEELTEEEAVYGLTNDDAELRRSYSEGLEPLYRLAGGEEELGRLLEEIQ
jgi:hypothetical protein